MKTPHPRTTGNKARFRKAGLALALVLAGVPVWIRHFPGASGGGPKPQPMGIEAAGAVSARSPASRSTSSPTVSARPRIETQAPSDFLFASNRISGHILFSKGRDHRLIPDSDAPSGRDLWVRAGAGADRLIHSSVLSARFSPEGQRVAYTTTDRALLIEDLQGNKLAEVAGAYSPQWKPD